MAEQVFGLGINQVMAYTAIANVLLVVMLTAINIYYAGHAKRQADAAREQVNASNRQSEIAAETLSLLRQQMDQQHRTDIASVTLQLKVAVHVIEDWLKRISSEKHPQLPDEIGTLRGRGRDQPPTDAPQESGRAGSLEGSSAKGHQESEHRQIQAVRGPDTVGGNGRATALTPRIAAAHNSGA